MKNPILPTLLILLLAGCTPENEATDWTIMRAPSSGADKTIQVPANQASTISYELDPDIEAIELKPVIVDGPKFGKLQNCSTTALKISCVYTPNPNFTGIDAISFKAKDGDFTSENNSKLLIEVIGSPSIKESISFIYKSVDNTVCNPLKDGEQSGNSKGLVGNIRLIKELSALGSIQTSSERRSLQGMLNNYLDPSFSYQLGNQSIFMNEVNVPLTDFSKGFSTQNGESLKVEGIVLDEFFNVNLDTLMMIEEDAMAGEYEIAIASDDGSKLSYTLKTDSEDYTTYLESNKTHAIKFICTSGSQYLKFEKNKPIKARINYFQGPRYHIALQMYWRKKPADTSRSEYCDRSPSSSGLQSEGWSVIPQEVFNLPSEIVNTCSEDEKNDVVDSLSFKVAGASSINNLKIFIEDIGKGTVEQYSHNFSLTQLPNGSDYEIHLDVNNPILRDTDKKITLEFEKAI